MIDCLYQDATGVWRLIDYKTNQTSVDEVPRVAERYCLQMLVYALAIEQRWGQAPAELVLHFLVPGEEYRWAWSPELRQQGIELIGQAIEQVTT